MGEAKRRRQKAGDMTSVPAIDPRTGDVVGYARYAGMSASEFFDRFRRQARNDSRQSMPVPCNGCTSCCYSKTVPLEPGESEAGLDIVIDTDGERILRKRDDGACVHLGPNGCTVYDYRPMVCRRYDCRIYGLMDLSDSYDGDRHSPAWLFETPTEQDRALIMALRMGLMPIIFGPPGWTTMDALKTTMSALDKNYPKAQAMIAEFDALPAETRQAMEEWLRRAGPPRLPDRSEDP